MNTPFFRSVWLNLVFLYRKQFHKEEVFSYKIPTYTDRDGRRYGKLWFQHPIHLEDYSNNWFVHRDAAGYVKDYGGNIPDDERARMIFRP